MEHWRTKRANKKKLLGPGEIPHETVDLQIYHQVERGMAEPTHVDETQQHQEDDDTTWFGLDRDAEGDPVLAEYRRYAAIMLQNDSCAGMTRLPALVSFVGLTGMSSSKQN